MRLVCALFLLIAGPLWGEEVVLGLSQDEVSITATFDGSDILIFGAIKREAPAPQDSNLDIVITVAGPARPVVVRRKAQTGPIWVNTTSLTLPTAPAFYAVAATRGIGQSLSAPTDAQHQISTRALLNTRAQATGRADAGEFVEALMRLRRAERLYQELPFGVLVSEDTLFRAQIALPADLTEGHYRARIFLLREGEVVDMVQTTIPVRKVGMERLLYRMAQDQPLRYGILALVIAALAGWLASQAFALLRR